MRKGSQPIASESSLSISCLRLGKKPGNWRKRKKTCLPDQSRCFSAITLTLKLERQWWKSKDTCLLARKARSRFRYRAIMRRGSGK